MPFDDDYEEEKPKKGLKINPNKSIFSSLPQKPSPQEFEKRADDAHSQQEDYKQRGYELGLKFKTILNDKVLPENKTSINLDVEREVLQGLLQLAQDINSDENEIEGQGSVAVIAVALKSILMQRDRLNAIEYKLHKQDQTIKELKASVDQLVEKLSSFKNKEEK